MKTRLFFYLDPAYSATSSAIAYHYAWTLAGRHKAPHALRRELRDAMRFYAVRAVKLARSAAKREVVA